MPTIRLYRAIKERDSARAAYDAARHTGNYTPDKPLPHNSPIVMAYRDANVEFQLAMLEADMIIQEPDDRRRAVATRIAGERDICRFLVASLIEQGYDVGGNDGEEDIEYGDLGTLHSVMFDVDMFFINVRKDGEEGWIQLVFGNSPAEVISNHTVNITKATVPTQKYIKSFYDPTYIIDEGK